MQKNIQVPLHDKPDFECPKCNSVLFTPAFALKVIPPFVAANDKPVIVPVQAFSCANCGYCFQPEDVEKFLHDKTEYSGKLVFTNPVSNGKS